MDEPFSSLDTVLKNELQYMILRLVKELKLIMIYVTHNREEALAMANKIVVMVHGAVIQTGNIKELSENPETDFVEKFMRGI
jgi:ABC-type proline/glycine betaine transport system ATPase subunit